MYSVSTSSSLKFLLEYILKKLFVVFFDLITSIPKCVNKNELKMLKTNDNNKLITSIPRCVNTNELKMFKTNDNNKYKTYIVICIQNKLNVFFVENEIILMSLVSITMGDIY